MTFSSLIRNISLLILGGLLGLYLLSSLGASLFNLVADVLTFVRRGIGLKVVQIHVILVFIKLALLVVQNHRTASTKEFLADIAV